MKLKIRFGWRLKSELFFLKESEPVFIKKFEMVNDWSLVLLA